MQSFDFADAGIPLARKQGFQAGLEVGEDSCCRPGPQIITESRQGPPGGFNVCIINPFPGECNQPPSPSPFPDQYSMRYSAIDQKADLPLQQLGIIAEDGMYQIDGGFVIKTTDSGGGSLTATCQFTTLPSAPGMSSPLSAGPTAMSSLGGAYFGSVLYDELVFLLAGTPILFSCTGGSYAAGGSYDFFLSAKRLA